ncbi:hypothetical protein Pcinc_025620 [Petrolisthes cinctipes]|uniref:Uncharacterized protein n=1 Tax=Petrolisthes cinctipes TaxID=88211 RepID=A0AAE1F7J5_PETCI|nr:hypothetical protein Pcinc_025620 [Petrolisthes cinctipes]
MYFGGLTHHGCDFLVFLAPQIRYLGAVPHRPAMSLVVEYSRGLYRHTHLHHKTTEGKANTGIRYNSFGVHRWNFWRGGRGLALKYDEPRTRRIAARPYSLWAESELMVRQASARVRLTPLR